MLPTSDRFTNNISKKTVIGNEVPNEFEIRMAMKE